MTRLETMNRSRFTQQSPGESKPTINMHRMSPDQTGCMGHEANQMPDITDFMNDVFFGSADQKKVYSHSGPIGRGQVVRDRVMDEFDSSTRSVSSRQTQEWLEEAKRLVASSPSRGHDSPSRLVVSPRFGITKGRSSISSLDKRDPLSRSARRHKALEGFSEEILSRTAAGTTHTGNRSESNSDPPESGDLSPASDLQKWLSKLSNHSPPSSPPPLPPRQSMQRKSRFQTPSDAPTSHPIPVPTNLPAFSPSRRTFKTASTNGDGAAANLDSQLLSPPKKIVESAHRRSSSSSSMPEFGVLSPPRNLVESAHRRSISSSTCRTDRSLKKDNSVVDRQFKDVGLKDVDLSGHDLNAFLKEQRIKVFKLMNGEIKGRAKVVLSGRSNSTSSMVAATCYAWLMENRMKANKKEGMQNDHNLEFFVPVMNIRRGKMWKQRQVAWLFHHVGLDASSLLFSNEVELESLMMAMQLSMVEVGVDILKTNNEVRSACTVLTDNYCQDAYDHLQTPMLKKLLLAGILLDTQNLNASQKMSMTRDAEAVQLLTVASAPNYRNILYNQLTQDQRDNDFFEALSRTYGKPPSDIKWGNGESTGNRVSEKIPSHDVTAPSDDLKQNDTNDPRKKIVSPASGKPTPSPTPAPVQTPTKANNDTLRGKNRGFFAKLFGFGSK